MLLFTAFYGLDYVMKFHNKEIVFVIVVGVVKTYVKLEIYYSKLSCFLIEFSNQLFM